MFRLILTHVVQVISQSTFSIIDTSFLNVNTFNQKSFHPLLSKPSALGTQYFHYIIHIKRTGLATSVGPVLDFNLSAYIVIRLCIYRNGIYGYQFSVAFYIVRHMIGTHTYALPSAFALVPLKVCNSGESQSLLAAI